MGKLVGNLNKVERFGLGMAGSKKVIVFFLSIGGFLGAMLLYKIFGNPR